MPNSSHCVYSARTCKANNIPPNHGNYQETRHLCVSYAPLNPVKLLSMLGVEYIFLPWMDEEQKAEENLYTLPKRNQKLTSKYAVITAEYGHTILSIMSKLY